MKYYFLSYAFRNIESRSSEFSFGYDTSTDHPAVYARNREDAKTIFKLISWQEITMEDYILFNNCK